ncbi:hypothetical protein [Carnobacterium maltaromaticum]|uniref:hypothetical protein n=1 Tax=Carnobacterium maltaromaticum TaxID=2751 RepID=UPI00165C58E1|nr:hypothetical protein [Carnobacterium maltaromaticum]MBC9810495.1 hypothetical protein [Carnobacterium maltaromaticum]
MFRNSGGCSSFIISKQDGLSSSDDYFEFSIDYLVGLVKKKNTSSIFEEVLINILSEFDGVICPSFIDYDREIKKSIIRNDLEISIKLKEILSH